MSTIEIAIHNAEALAAHLGNTDPRAELLNSLAAQERMLLRGEEVEGGSLLVDIKRGRDRVHAKLKQLVETTEKATGWYRGTVASRSLSARHCRNADGQLCCQVQERGHTGKMLNGSVACELSERLYGVDVCGRCSQRRIRPDSIHATWH